MERRILKALASLSDREVWEVLVAMRLADFQRGDPPELQDIKLGLFFLGLIKSCSYGISGIQKGFHMSPAEKVIKKFGSVRKLADAIGVLPVGVHKWTYPKERGGTGGLIPTDKHEKIVLAAIELEVDLEPSDFFADGLFECAR